MSARCSFVSRAEDREGFHVSPYHDELNFFFLLIYVKIVVFYNNNNNKEF